MLIERYNQGDDFPHNLTLGLVRHVGEVGRHGGDYLPGGDVRQRV